MAVADLMVLLDVAKDRLAPHFSSGMLTHKAALTFAGSAIVNADGDFISAAILFEFKAIHDDILRSSAVYQLLCYLLLDFDDAYPLEGVAYCSARYGHPKPGQYENSRPP